MYGENTKTITIPIYRVLPYCVTMLCTFWVHMHGVFVIVFGVSNVTMSSVYCVHHLCKYIHVYIILLTLRLSQWNWENTPTLCIITLICLQVNDCRVDFSSVCCQISEHISKNMSEDISVPICFVFLLHLANEKARSINFINPATDSIIHVCYKIHRMEFIVCTDKDCTRISVLVLLWL